mgnify:CR=1 FL=1
MPKPSASLAFFPPAVENQLAELGANLQIARKRRGESRAAWASRLGVTSPTLLLGADEVGSGCILSAHGQYFAAQTALGRVGEPDDVGRVIAGLLGDEQAWVNAQTIEVAGGYNI